MRDPRFFVPGRYHLPPAEPITHFDVVPATEGALADSGMLIAWPNGETWAHVTETQALTPNEAKEAA